MGNEPALAAHASRKNENEDEVCILRKTHQHYNSTPSTGHFQRKAWGALKESSHKAQAPLSSTLDFLKLPRYWPDKLCAHFQE